MRSISSTTSWGVGTKITSGVCARLVSWAATGAPASSATSCAATSSVGMRMRQIMPERENPVAKRIRARLVAGDRHVFDQDRAHRAAAAHHDIASHRGDAAEHVAQVARNGDLLHRKADLAALDPVAGGAAR